MDLSKPGIQFFPCSHHDGHPPVVVYWDGAGNTSCWIVP